jgi:hypothetical protein
VSAEHERLVAVCAACGRVGMERRGTPTCVSGMQRRALGHNNNLHLPRHVLYLSGERRMKERMT